MNHSTPVPAQAVASVDAVFQVNRPGVFFIYENGGHIYAECPCGCGSHMRLPIHAEDVPAPSLHPNWWWNGDRDKPTLRPSIRDMAGCRYHGHLTDGVWTFETDSGVC